MNIIVESKLNKQIINLKAKLRHCGILFNDILIFLELDHRNASLKILYLVVLGINVINCCQKFNVLNKRISILVKIIQMLCFLYFYRKYHPKFEIDKTILTCLNTTRADRYARTHGHTLIIEKL